MWSVNKYNEIRMTRGDTPAVGVVVTIETEEGKQQYVPVEGDHIIFAMANEEGTVLVKEIPHDTMLLTFYESDTGDLEEGEYQYEISLNSGDYHCTFIPSTRLILTREYYTERTHAENPEIPLTDRIEGTIPSFIRVDGTLSQPGIPGLSAYEIAVRHGYEGTEEEWLESLKPSQEEMDSKITAPATAAVGQILCVEAVDENGKPTAWKTVDRGAILY